MKPLTWLLDSRSSHCQASHLLNRNVVVVVVVVFVFDVVVVGVRSNPGKGPNILTATFLTFRWVSASFQNKRRLHSTKALYSAALGSIPSIYL